MQAAQQAPPRQCPTSSKTEAKSAPLENEALIKRLMAHFTVRYPGTFSQSINTPYLQQTFVSDWGAGLARFDWQRFAVALERCAKRPNDQYCPSLGTFISFCEMDYSELRMPEPEVAYEAACSGKFPHDAVWFAAKKVGTNRLRRLAESTTRPDFMKAYELARNKLRQDEVLPTRPAPRGTIAPIKKTAPQQHQDREIARAALDELKGQFGISPKPEQETSEAASDR